MAGESAIQQVVGGAPVYGCTATMVVTNHRYTRAAEHLAAVHGCLLVDRPRLARWARASRGVRSVPPTPRGRPQGLAGREPTP